MKCQDKHTKTEALDQRVKITIALQQANLVRSVRFK